MTQWDSRLPDWVGHDPDIHRGFLDRGTCVNWTTLLLQNGTILLDRDAWLFAKDPATGQSLHDPDDMTLTVPGCERLCGGRSFYIDAGPRFMTWILPIVLLLSNIELSPIDKRRFTTIVQVLGDPVEAIWSMLHKLQTWKALDEIARQYCADHRIPDSARVVATVLAGFEDVLGPSIPDRDWITTSLLHQIGPAVSPEQMKRWQRAAFELSDGRTDEFLRTILAISLYVLQVMSAFIPDVGGEPSTPPGGVIGSALFLGFLVPAAFLSNVLGSFASQRSGLSALSRLVRTAVPPPSRDDRVLIERASWAQYFSHLQFSGGNNTYRPWKSSDWVQARRRWTLLTAAWAASPVLASFAGAFPIMFFAVPNGFSCRHVWLVLVFGLWMLGALFSSALYPFLRHNRRLHWQITLTKDVLIGVGGLMVVTLSAMGGFNSCSCWGRELVLGRAAAAVPITATGRYQMYDRSVYPTVVGSVIGFQLLFCFLTIVWYWKGVTLMRWSEGRRQRLWEALESDVWEHRAQVLPPGRQRAAQRAAPRGSPRYYMLFWYYHVRKFENA